MAAPNILVITLARQAWNAAGYCGFPALKTPSLDVLATHGVHFSEAITPTLDPVEARAILFTGRHDGGGIPFTHHLSEMGYKVAAVGNIGDVQPEWLSMANVRQTCPDWINPNAEMGLLHFEDVNPPQHTYLDMLEAQDVSPEEAFASDVLHPVYWTGSQAVRHIQHCGEPFFLWVSFPGVGYHAALPSGCRGVYKPEEVHLPEDWPVAEDPMIVHECWPQWMGWLSLVDHQIGRILATLAARGRTNNRVLVTALGGHPGPQPFQHDWSIRIPLILAGVTGQRKHQRDPALATLEDVRPTLLDWAGVGAPEREECAGISLLPRLMDSGGIHRAVACSRPVPGVSVARGERYKFVRDADGRKTLYDLQNDPAETASLYGRLMVFRAGGQLEEGLAAWEAVRR